MKFGFGVVAIAFSWRSIQKSGSNCKEPKSLTMITGIIKALFLVVLYTITNALQGQVVIGDVNLSAPLDVTECSTLSIGQTIQFTRTSNCTGNNLIILDNVEVLNTSDVSPSFTFPQAEEYIVFTDQDEKLGGYA